MTWFTGKASPGNGPWAEQQAQAFLEGQGMALVAKNYRCKVGEIDLIMTHLDKLIFVEVRFRRSERFGTALDTIDSRKQSKIIKAARYYLQKHHLSERYQCRFDVIGVSLDSQQQCQITWIENAFAA